MELRGGEQQAMNGGGSSESFNESVKFHRSNLDTSATSVQHLHLGSWIMSCCISSASPVSPCLTPLFDSVLRGPDAWKKADAAIWQSFFSKACFTNFTRKHLTEPKCCQTTCCRGPWAQHNDHTSDKYSLLFAHTDTVWISFFCRSFFVSAP